MTAALLSVLPLSAGRAQSHAQLSREEVTARVDSMARAYMAAKGPASMSIAITRGSETLLTRAWGLADVAANRPATAASVYKIGSVSKQFTAVLVLRQVERNRLALTDSIGHYLATGLRPEWRSLTIEQLLNHTSGLPNDFERQVPPYDVDVPAATLISWAARDTMLFAPGTRFAYSNVGYVLLGALVEKLYDKSYGEALREEIAGPLGLQTLGWCTRSTDATATTGYSYDGPNELREFPWAHPSLSLGAGGLCATAGDLAAWNQALHGGKVLSPASYAAMTTPRGRAAPRYGFGLQVNPTPWGAPVMYHLGAVTGFAAENAWFPAESLSVAILYNSLGPGNGFPTNFILDVARAISTPAQPK